MSHSQAFQDKLDSHSKAKHIGFPGTEAVLKLRPLRVRGIADNSQLVMHRDTNLDQASIDMVPKGDQNPNFKTWNLSNFLYT